MRLLSLVEQLLILLEKRQQPMHVGALFLFDLPKNANSDFVAKLVQRLKADTTAPASPFNQVLYKVVFWQTTTTLDVSQHLYHECLTPVPTPHINSQQANNQQPNSLLLSSSQKSNSQKSNQPERSQRKRSQHLRNSQQLLDYVSAQHAKPLDKTRPLWQCHIIENIAAVSGGEPRRFGLYFKIHHAVVDGIAAMRLLEKSLSPSSDERMRLPPWALVTRDPKNLPTIEPPKRQFSQVIKQQLSTIKPVASELKNSVAHRNSDDYVKTTQAPRCIFNQRISANRAMLTHSCQRAGFTSLATQLQCTNNDVVLAVCAGALRRYLLLVDELPSKPLVAFVPISLRQDDSAIGNQVSFVLCNLGTHLTDPQQRLHTIRQSMQRGKRLFGRMTQAEIINYSAIAYGWEGVNLLTNAYPKKQAFNVIISNLPGPKQTLYWNGAKLSAIYPASIIFDGQALNITLVNHQDRIDFGMVACADNLPYIHNLPNFIDQALAELASLSKMSNN